MVPQFVRAQTMEGREILALYEEIYRRGSRARPAKPRWECFAADRHIGAIGFAIVATLGMRLKLQPHDPITCVVEFLCHSKRVSQDRRTGELLSVTSEN